MNMVPKGYKHSPFGNIPDDWNVKELSSVAKIKRGRFSPRPRNDPKFYGGNIPFVQTSDISLSNGHVYTYNQTLNDEGLKVSILFPKGTILMTIASNIGHCAIIEIDMACPDSLVGITCEKDTNEEFLNYFLQHIRKKIEYIAPGAQKNINVEFLNALPILNPPFNEQLCIVTLINSIDKLYNLNCQLIEKKELQKIILINQLLTGKSRLQGFKKTWSKYNYGDVLKVVRRTSDWDDEKLYNLISVKRRSGGIFLREALYGHQILVKNLRLAEEGDFLFSKMQILHGASALVTEEFADTYISGSYIAVVAKDEKLLNMEYFNWYSQLPYFYHQTYISSYGVHIEKMTFDFETFLSLNITLPTVEEQIAINKVLKLAAKEIELLKTKADKLKKQKKGMMQLLLTGKKRLI